MGDENEIGPDGISTGDLKSMFKELLDDNKKEIIEQIQSSMDRADDIGFSEEEDNSIVSDPAIVDKIESFVTQPSSSKDKPITSDSFKDLVEEFSISEKTSPAISSGLADIVNSLLKDKLPKEKLEEVQKKYCRPENCPNLLAPKVNKQIWQQLQQETKNTDSAMQKAQALLTSGVCAILQVCNKAEGETRNMLTHAAVLLLSANREFNLKRRDLVRPDLNKQYNSLCNPATEISSHLFGDNLSKDVEDLAKANKLSNKVTNKQRQEHRSHPYRGTASRGFRGRGRYQRGRGSRTHFLGYGRGQSRTPSSTKTHSQKSQ